MIPPFHMEQMPGAIRFSVRIPPSVNHAFRNTTHAERARYAQRRGKPLGPRVKTDAYNKWRDAAGWEIAIQRVPPLHGDVGVFIECPLPKHRDCDNTLKLLLDLLVYMHVLDDDSQVDDLRIKRVKGDGDAIVTIWPIPAESAA